MSDGLGGPPRTSNRRLEPPMSLPLIPDFCSVGHWQFLLGSHVCDRPVSAVTSPNTKSHRVVALSKRAVRRWEGAASWWLWWPCLPQAAPRTHETVVQRPQRPADLTAGRRRTKGPILRFNSTVPSYHSQASGLSFGFSPPPVCPCVRRVSEQNTTRDVTGGGHPPSSQPWP